MELDDLRFEQKSFHLFLFSFLRVLVVRAHAFLYERKSVIEPVRQKILKSSDLLLTASVQVEFHHGGEGGNVLLIDLLRGIVVKAELHIILVKEE